MLEVLRDAARSNRVTTAFDGEGGTELRPFNMLRAEGKRSYPPASKLAGPHFRTLINLASLGTHS